MKKLAVLVIAIVFAMTAVSVYAQEAAPKAIDKEVKSATAAVTAKAKDEKPVFPFADVVKTGETFVVICDLPGVLSKDVNIEYVEGEKNYLEITGTKNDVAAAGKGEKVAAERFTGKFSKRIELTEKIIKDKILAEFENNTLIITLPILKYQVKTTIKIK
jgi:HSP20 family molecular chaperone IbpA